MKPKPKTKNPAPVQLELFTVEPRPIKRAAWSTQRGSCYRLRAAVVREAPRFALCVGRTSNDLDLKALTTATH
jgi:hypothetical protein